MSDTIAGIDVSGTDTLATWGPVVLGALFACLLQGYVYGMAVGYFTMFARKDSWRIRGLVIVIMVLTTVETALYMTKDVKQTVIHTGDVVYVLLLHERPDEYLIPVFTNSVIMLCQAFLCWRSYRFARAMQDVYGNWMKAFTTVLASFTLILFALGLAGTISLVFHLSKATSLLFALVPSLDTTSVSFWFYWCFAIFVLLDVMIVIATTVQLRAARTGFVESNTILGVIINLTLRNGTLILVSQVAQLVLFHTAITGESYTKAWVTFPSSFLSRFYTITVLSTLLYPRAAQRNIRIRQADEEAAIQKMSHTPLSSSTTQIDLENGNNSSEPSTRCLSCGSHTLGVSGRGASGTPKLGYTIGARSGMMRDGGQFLPTEAPVSFASALFGMESPTDGTQAASRQRGGSMQREGYLWNEKQNETAKGKNEEYEAVEFIDVGAVLK